MSRTDLSDTEATVLVLLREEGSADLYALARAVGMGPRSVQEALHRLCRDGLAEASDRGASFRCTSDGKRVARDWQEHPSRMDE